MPNFSFYFKDRIFVVITIIVWWECSSQEKTGMKTNSYKKTRSILLLFLFDTQEYNLIQLCLVSFPFCHALNPPQICRRTVYNSETVLYACLLAAQGLNTLICRPHLFYPPNLLWLLKETIVLIITSREDNSLIFWALKLSFNVFTNHNNFHESNLRQERTPHLRVAFDDHDFHRPLSIVNIKKVIEREKKGKHHITGRLWRHIWSIFVTTKMMGLGDDDPSFLLFFLLGKLHGNPAIDVS